MLDASLLSSLLSLLLPGVQGNAAGREQLATKLQQIASELQADNAESQPAPDGPKGKAARRHKRRGADRDFDFDAYQTRYVALQFFYIGGNYHGFAAQCGTEATIEAQLFSAMNKVRLVPEGKTWQELNYSRCGRTDKGVSALEQVDVQRPQCSRPAVRLSTEPASPKQLRTGHLHLQVVALRLRSSARVGQAPLPEDQELDYAAKLNRALPADIKVLGWTTVPEGFSARFSTLHREYRYFIAQRGLDLAAMRAAAAHLVGTHDFRNFCKLDVEHVHSFERTILVCEIVQLPPHAPGTAAEVPVCVLHVKGTAFLWHQVRCIAAVLIMVGQGLEPPSVVAQLLDVDRHPAKPQYNMAPEAPLLFYECQYQDLHFRCSADAQRLAVAAAEGLLHQYLVGKLLSTCLLERACEGMAPAGRTEVKHIPLLKRAREPDIAARLQKARRLQNTDLFNNSPGEPAHDSVNLDAVCLI